MGFGRGLPAAPAPAPAPAPGTPNLSDAITQLKGGNRQSAEAMMRQIVGLPPLNAPGQQPITTPDINRPITNMPVPGPGVAAPYPQAPFGSPARSPMAMRQYLEQQNQLALQMNQPQQPQLLQPGAQPSLIGMQGAQPSPYEINQQRQSLLNQLPAYQQLESMKKVMEMQSQGNPLFRPSADQMSEINALQQQIANNPQMQALQKQGQAFQQQQPYMPQSMTMDMPQAQRPMLELPTQPMDDGTIMGRATNMMSNAGFGSQVNAAFGSNMQPQNPVQPMGQFQQNNAQQMSNFQNQNQPAQNTQQRSGGGGGGLF